MLPQLGSRTAEGAMHREISQRLRVDGARNEHEEERRHFQIPRISAGQFSVIEKQNALLIHPARPEEFLDPT